MPTSLVLACLWALGANLLRMRPSRDNHWRLSCGLIAAGIPVLGYVTYQTGPWIGLVCLVAAMSILRWPAARLWRGLRGQRHGLAKE